MTGRRVNVNGIVQGVGFRPFVFQLAEYHKINGNVSNTSSGVFLHIEGSQGQLEAFMEDLHQKAPPLAHITEINQSPEALKHLSSFKIVSSSGRKKSDTLISPDVSVCDDCRRELFDPDNRRYRYPFINCTNCGPRYTIIDDMPYDRPNTSMKHFPMCPACQAEYDDPLNRRFHAQPNACPDCGPQLTLYDHDQKRIKTDDPVRETARLLKMGHIVAIKGIGGYHLAADAVNDEAVNRLRKRKHREEKPLALMALDLSAVRKFAHVTPGEEALLVSNKRPIVLLAKKSPNSISSGISPKNRYFGTMLPYTPLHYLLMSCGFTALVMTSGNLSEEPIAVDNEAAFDRLSGIADYFLTHNRDIYVRCDDSIMRHDGRTQRFIRRSRGYAPVPIFLNRKMPVVLACGGALKNTVCFTRGRNAFLSQHIGDLENPKAYDGFCRTIDQMKRILDVKPDVIACDLHPDYLSTRYAEEQRDIPLIRVQHHHAHIAGVMAENRIGGPVMGLAFDGTGLGTDGTLWGGEILLAEEDQFKRLAYFQPIAMPGGTAAIREPWRMGVSYLYHVYGDDLFNLDLPLINTVGVNKVRFIVKMIQKGVNSPLTSSLGRLFDGIAAICGVRYTSAFEGQAAMELEMMAEKGDEWRTGPNDMEKCKKIPIKPIIEHIIMDMRKGLPSSLISYRFHMGLIRMVTGICENIGKAYGLNRVAMSGGVFQNMILQTGLDHSLRRKGFNVYTNRQVPVNDGGLSLGQAVVAASQV